VIERLAAKLAEEREAAVQKAALLENRVEEQAPKVAALERIEAGKKSLTITEAAKVLGVKRDELTKRLHAEGWIYRQNRSWVAHSAQIHAGRMEYKEAHYTDDDGNETARPYCHLTPKGLSRFAQIIGTNRDGLF
jgi:phage antirepressor YoqD-like protein